MLDFMETDLGLYALIAFVFLCAVIILLLANAGNWLFKNRPSIAENLVLIIMVIIAVILFKQNILRR